MYWYCEFCGSSNLESQDLCSNCEILGCTKNNHLCQEENSNMNENYILEMKDDRKQASKYSDPEWIEEKIFGEEYHYEEND